MSLICSCSGADVSGGYTVWSVSAATASSVTNPGMSVNRGVRHSIVTEPYSASRPGLS